MAVSDPAKNVRSLSTCVIAQSQRTHLDHRSGWSHNDIEHPTLSRPGRYHVADESTGPALDTEGID